MHRILNGDKDGIPRKANRSRKLGKWKPAMCKVGYTETEPNSKLTLFRRRWASSCSTRTREIYQLRVGRTNGLVYSKRSRVSGRK